MPHALDVRREDQLLLACARVVLTDEDKQALEALAEQPLDWDYVLYAAAEQQRIVPLVHRHLKSRSAVPQEVRRRLSDLNLASVQQSLLLDAELKRLARLFADAGIPILPFKGPLLATSVYGHLYLRTYGDLDLLVHEADLERASHLLEGEGYEPAKPAPSEADDALAKTVGAEKSYELVKDDVVVELHWSFLHPMHGAWLAPEAVWDRAAHVELGRAEVCTFALEDRVLYLCAHGAKHYWERLTWLCDLAETLRGAEGHLDVPRLVARATEAHGLRILYLGLLLAHDLLGAPVFPTLLTHARTDERVQELASLATGWLFQAGDRKELRAEHARFHFLMRERLRDRLPYAWHLARLAAAPSEKDRAAIRLPETLDALYYLVRPLRIAKNRLAQFWGGIRD